MQKENRNNRVHTGEQSGKTDFLIERLLPVGKENAITTQDLVKLSGCGSARELQQRIAYERERVQFDQNDDVQYTDPEKKQSQIDERKENFEKIYAIYPKKRGKQRAFGLYCQWLKGRVIQGERIKLTNKEMYVAVRLHCN